MSVYLREKEGVNAKERKPGSVEISMGCGKIAVVFWAHNVHKCPCACGHDSWD